MSPRGPISIDPQTRDIVQTVYVRRVEKKDGKLCNIEFDKFENVKDPDATERGRPVLGNFVGVLFDGIAYGSLLFLISIGLSVTMGLMNFVNLAHGAFAMLGGYAASW